MRVVQGLQPTRRSKDYVDADAILAEIYKAAHTKPRFQGCQFKQCIVEQKSGNEVDSTEVETESINDTDSTDVETESTMDKLSLVDTVDSSSDIEADTAAKSNWQALHQQMADTLRDTPDIDDESHDVQRWADTAARIASVCRCFDDHMDLEENDVEKWNMVGSRLALCFDGEHDNSSA